MVAFFCGKLEPSTVQREHHLKLSDFSVLSYILKNYPVIVVSRVFADNMDAKLLKSRCFWKKLIH